MICDARGCKEKQRMHSKWCKKHQDVRPTIPPSLPTIIKKPKKNKYVEKFKENGEKEHWFMQFYLSNENDRYFLPVAGYIFSIMNKKYRYVIDVDSEYADTVDGIVKTTAKDKYLTNKKYTVIRICYRPQQPERTMKSLEEGLKIIYSLRGMKGHKSIRSYKNYTVCVNVD